ncbi:MAG: hypothetical protein AAB074_04150 [Planctomycetota bacterium]
MPAALHFHLPTFPETAIHHARLVPALAAIFAISLFAFAEDPPKDDGKARQESEARFNEFCRAWRRSAAPMEEGLTRTFTFEAKGGEVPLTGTVEILTRVPDPESVVFEKKVKLDNEEELKGKRVELPPLIAARVWAEPPPLMFPEKVVVTLEKDVEVKVGEKTLKCLKLTLTTGEDAPVPNLNMSYWICEEEHLGLVRATQSSGTGKSMTLQLAGWKSAEK